MSYNHNCPRLSNLFQFLRLNSLYSERYCVIQICLLPDFLITWVARVRRAGDLSENIFGVFWFPELEWRRMSELKGKANKAFPFFSLEISVSKQVFPKALSILSLCFYSLWLLLLISIFRAKFLAEAGGQCVSTMDSNFWTLRFMVPNMNIADVWS